MNKRLRSFRYAFDGWAFVLRTQHNSWIHALITIAVVATGLWLGIERLGWALIIAAITMVWVTEFINTAIEVAVDIISPEVAPSARIVKDVAAAAVLVSACGSVVIGLLVLGPPLLARLFP